MIHHTTIVEPDSQTLNTSLARKVKVEENRAIIHRE